MINQLRTNTAVILKNNYVLDTSVQVQAPAPAPIDFTAADYDEPRVEEYQSTYTSVYTAEHIAQIKAKAEDSIVKNESTIRKTGEIVDKKNAMDERMGNATNKFMCRAAHYVAKGQKGFGSSTKRFEQGFNF